MTLKNKNVRMKYLKKLWMGNDSPRNGLLQEKGGKDSGRTKDNNYFY